MVVMTYDYDIEGQQNQGFVAKVASLFNPVQALLTLLQITFLFILFASIEKFVNLFLF